MGLAGSLAERNCGCCREKFVNLNAKAVQAGAVSMLLAPLLMS